MKRIVLNAAGAFVLLAALFLAPVNSEVHAASQGLNCQGSGNITLELDPGHGYDTSTKTGDTGAVNTTYNYAKFIILLQNFLEIMVQFVEDCLLFIIILILAFIKFNFKLQQIFF